MKHERLDESSAGDTDSTRPSDETDGRDAPQADADGDKFETPPMEEFLERNQTADEL